MKIKDVEKLTGLTAKSIRYYESKRLIAVERNEENSYRNYTDADVARLKWIKMFRYLDFSIEEIEKLLSMDAARIKEALRQKAESFSERENLLEDKRTLCLSLARDYDDPAAAVEKYSGTVEYLESDEWRDLKEQLEDHAAPDLVSAVALTLICLAPAFWLFYNIKTARTGLLMFNVIAALLGTALTTWNWTRYASQVRKNKARVRRKTRKTVWLIPAMIAAFLLGLAAMMGGMALLQNLLVPEDFLFFEHGPVAGALLIWLIMLPAILFCVLLVERLRKKPAEEMEDVSDLLFLWNRLGRWRAAVVAVWLLALYCCAFSFTAVTEDRIVRYSPGRPTGVEYAYSEVESIRTGFGDKNFFIAEYRRKGSFYYQIEIDGRAVTFHAPTVNGQIERYREHTYLELEEFDRALTALGIPKEADESGWENCDLDKEYVDRFLRIIRSE